jgi:hypothetical protein
MWAIREQPNSAPFDITAHVKRLRTIAGDDAQH